MKLLDCLGRIAVSSLLALVLVGCTPIYSHHGYVPSDADLETIKVGTSTTEDVALNVGRPSSIGVLAGSAWYYVGSRYRQIGPRAPVEIDRQVVAITFDEGGVVENVERFGLEKGEVVAISRRVTATSVKGIGVLRQLLSGLGRVNAATLLGAPPVE